MKFSILTSSYNNENYLEGWLNSVIKQSFRPLEVVFVNDNSSDKTYSKISKIESALSKVDIEFKFINNEKRFHYGTCCKIAFENSSGDIMCHLDSDDELSYDCVTDIVEKYNANPTIGYMWTQFNIHGEKMQFRSKGFSRMVKSGESILSMGINKIHTASHLRTFSRRVPSLSKLWKDGLRSSVDKYMFYRLEEQAIGGFWNKVCYNYRYGNPNAISKSEPAMKNWEIVKKEAVDRRKKYNLKAHKIVEIK